MQNWDREVNACLDARFSAAPRVRAYYATIWREHYKAGLAGPHFVRELTRQSETTFRSRVWEMLLARHLRACGHAVTSLPQGEPDFRFMIGDLTVWVEAISPTPGADLPRHWTTFDPANPGPAVGCVPNKEMLLRWTSAFKEKAERCREYRQKGVVGSADAFVIAIDGSQLSKFPHTHGVSRLPFVVEAVFAIGPLAFQVDQSTGKLGRAFQTVEATVENRNKSLVPKERFYRPEFTGVSAVLGCCPSPHAAPMLPVQIAYNPLAGAPIAHGQLGLHAEEWMARLVARDSEGQDWSVERVSDHVHRIQDSASGRPNTS